MLRRDGYRCRVCDAPGRGKRTITVHHRVPGRSVLSLMIALCPGLPCAGAPDTHGAARDVAPCCSNSGGSSTRWAMSNGSWSLTRSSEQPSRSRSFGVGASEAARGRLSRYSDFVRFCLAQRFFCAAPILCRASSLSGRLTLGLWTALGGRPGRLAAVLARARSVLMRARTCWS